MKVKMKMACVVVCMAALLTACTTSAVSSPVSAATRERHTFTEISADGDFSIVCDDTTGVEYIVMEKLVGNFGYDHCITPRLGRDGKPVIHK